MNTHLNQLNFLLTNYVMHPWSYNVMGHQVGSSTAHISFPTVILSQFHTVGYSAFIYLFNINSYTKYKNTVAAVALSATVSEFGDSRRFW